MKFAPAPIIFPYKAKIICKKKIEIDGEIKFVVENLEVPADIRFRKNGKIVVITRAIQDVYFQKCDIQLFTSRNILKNSLESYLIISDLGLVKIFCKIKG